MNRNSRRRLYWLSLGFVAAIGCGAKDEGVGADVGSGEDPSEADDDRNGSGNGNGSGSGKDGGVARMDAGDPDYHPPSEVEMPDATCAATSAEAPKVVVTKEVVVESEITTVKPVAIYLMLDRSSSMVGTCAPQLDPTLPANCNPESWKQATEAITAFAKDPASAGINVALGYFPPIVSIAQADKPALLCSGSSCATPTVSMRPANDNAAVIADSLAAATPPNSLVAPLYTPTECALRGLGSFCKAHTERTKEKCVGVLITDGVPQGDCNVDTNALAMIAADAASMAGGSTQIFTLGLTGARFDFLDRIAMSGGTDCTPNAAGNACNVTAGKDAFIAALKAIRETVVTKMSTIQTHMETKEVPLDCEWTLPEPPEDMKFDPKNVNVTFSATGKDPMQLGRVPASTDEECKKHPEGWRYDSEESPKKVLACEKACEMIKTSSGAKISIEFGCKGKTLE
jgi:hypothetical protein